MNKQKIQNSICLILFGIMDMTGLLAQAKTQAFKPINRASIVKVFSGLCGNEFDGFQGSGLLFQHGNSIYVLTSEHVVIHSNQNVCHLVYHETFGERKATLKAADWGYGLAVLKLNENVAVNDLLLLDELNSARVQNGQSVTVTGYPFSSFQAVEESYGRVITGNSQRHLIPLVHEMTEIIESHGEFGMSGGAVFDSGSKRFLGILSHQFIREQPGRASEIDEYQEETQVDASHLLAIPGSVAYQWLKKILIENAQPSLIRDALSQMTAGPLTIRTGGLKFIELRTQATGSGNIGGNDGVGIGGNDGIGIGGNDGVGIGGNSSGNKCSQENPGHCVAVKITLDLDAPATHWPIPIRQEWLKTTIKYHLNRKANIKIPYFLRSNKQHTDIKIIYFHSLAEFFSLLQQDHISPVSLLVDSPFQNRTMPQYEQQLVMQAELIVSIIKSLPIQTDTIDAIAAKRLLAQLETLAQLLKALNWQLVEKSWLNELKDSHQAGWKFLINTYFDESVELLKSVIEINQILDKLKAS